MGRCVKPQPPLMISITRLHKVGLETASASLTFGPARGLTLVLLSENGNTDLLCRESESRQIFVFLSGAGPRFTPITVDLPPAFTHICLFSLNSGARADSEEDLHQLGQRSAGKGESARWGLGTRPVELRRFGPPEFEGESLKQSVSLLCACVGSVLQRSLFHFSHGSTRCVQR